MFESDDPGGFTVYSNVPSINNLRSEHGHIFRSILGIIVVIIVSLALMELILWTIFPKPLRQPFRSYTRQTIPGVKDEIIYERNRFGFRSVSMKTRQKPPGVFRIICLGGSTTDQPTQNTEDTWSAHLERALRPLFASHGMQVEVAAYGRGGECVLNRYSWTRKYLDEFHPDLVITLEGINDLSLLGGPGYVFRSLEEQLRLRDKIVTFQAKMDENNPDADNSTMFKFRRFSQIARRLNVLLRRYELRKAVKSGDVFEWHSKHMPQMQAWYRKLPYHPQVVRKNDPYDEFSAGIMALLSYMRDLDLPVVVLGQPVLWKETMTQEEIDRLWFYIYTPRGPVRASPKWLESEMNRYNLVQEESAGLLGLSYLNLDTCVPKNLEYYFDDCHFTDIGCKTVSDIIYPVVEEEILKVMGWSENPVSDQ
jgi:GDSL-like Lipase/Acylhydrolase family